MRVLYIIIVFLVDVVFLCSFRKQFWLISVKRSFDQTTLIRPSFFLGPRPHLNYYTVLRYLKINVGSAQCYGLSNFSEVSILWSSLFLHTRKRIIIIIIMLCISIPWPVFVWIWYPVNKMSIGLFEN